MEISMRKTTKKCQRATFAYGVAIGLLVSITPKAQAQNAAQEPAAILEIQCQNSVTYTDDLPDPSKLASSPGIAPIVSRSFMPWIYIADIISVNGKPAKGVVLADAK